MTCKLFTSLAIVVVAPLALQSATLQLAETRSAWAQPPTTATQPSESHKAIDAIESQSIFPLDSNHNHAPGIVEFKNGDLLVSWYRGSGERKADDVAVMGAWKRAGESSWSEPFVMADEPGFPDCNTCMHVDASDRLWLFWPTVIANSWESCLTRYQVADHPTAPTGLRWDRQGLVLLKPDDFSAEATRVLDELISQHLSAPLPPKVAEEIDLAKERLKDKLFQRLGWQPRCKSTVLPTGRILLPLYTDTFSISIMAISDDGGKSWYASKPIFGLGNIQPAVVRRNDGTLVAYMRNNGPGGKVLVSQSNDDGITWTVAAPTDVLNPGSGLDAVRLRSGRWALICNDTTNGRSKLTLMLSDDEGKSWKWSRSLEDHSSGQFHYPVIIQGRDESLHVVYSYFVEAGKTMKYVRLNENWITQAD
jgi:predicted neuraminidase